MFEKQFEPKPIRRTSVERGVGLLRNVCTFLNTARQVGNRGELRVYRDAEQLAQAAAELFVTVAAESIKAHGRFRVALSGGSTPRRVYQLLASDGFKRRVDWDRVDLFWGDERYVGADDRAIRAVLLG